MDGLPHYRHMFGRGGVPPAAHHQGFADPLLHGHYAAAGGMDPLLLQQEMMRRQDHRMLAAASSAADNNAFSVRNNLLACREEEELARSDQNSELSDARDRIAEVEPAARDASGRVAASHSPATSRIHAAQAAYQAQAAPQPFLNDSIERIVALQEQEAMQERGMDAVGRARLEAAGLWEGMGDSSGGALGAQSAFGGVLHHGRRAAAARLPMAAAAECRFSPYCGSGDPSRALPVGHHRVLAEEMALRERLRRRLMEEETIRNQQEQRGEMTRQHQRERAMMVLPALPGDHQERAADSTHGLIGTNQQRRQSQHAMGLPASPGETASPAPQPRPPSRDAEFHRLLQLQHMSDEELVKHAAEVQSLKRSIDQKDQNFALRDQSFAHQEHQSALWGHHSTLRDNLERHKGTAMDSQMEQQLIEASLFCNSLPNGGLSSASQLKGATISDQDLSQDCAHADAFVSGGFSSMLEAGQAGRQFSNGSEKIAASRADAVVSREFSSGSEAGQAGRQFPNGPEKIAVVRQASPMQQCRQSAGPQDESKPLRCFKNGTEVDAEGNFAPTNNGRAPAPRSTNADNAPPTANDSLASPDCNIIAKFLTVVISRVPEITPAIADLLPTGGDPLLLKREFPNVVDATLAELRSIKEQLTDAAGAGDVGSIDLLRRVDNCTAVIKPYKVHLSNATRMAALPFVPGAAQQEISLARGVPVPRFLPHPDSAARMIRTLPPGVLHPALAAKMMRHPMAPGVPHPAMTAGSPPSMTHHPAMAAGMMRPLPPDVAAEMMSGTPPVSFDPRTGQPLMPSIYHLMASATPEELAMLQQAHQANAALMQQAHQTQAVLKSNNSNLAKPVDVSEQYIPPVKKEATKPSSPDEDMPMMIAHKIKKKEAIKQKKKASKKKKKKNRKPILVHHAMYRGALDMSEEERRELLRREREAKRERALVAENGEGGTRSESKTGVNEVSVSSVVTEESEDHAAYHAVDPAGQSREEEDGHFGAASVLLDLMGN